VVENRPGGGAVVGTDGDVRSSVVSSQAELHARFGGVVPEIASRRHLELVLPVVREALADADAELESLDAVAVTQGPGLIGALLVGLSAAKGLAFAKELPLIPVDHLHGHVASLYLQPEPVEPPFLCLLASGGHTLLVDVVELGGFRVLGTTLDDAAGEAFDKGARLLGLGYPGGAAIDRFAGEGDPEAYDFPVARVPGLDFSFSGLKTAVARWVEARQRDGLDIPLADVAASFQEAVCDVLTAKAIDACAATGATDLLIGGGVAANGRLRALLAERAAERGIALRTPRPSMCTDNGAMIAVLGAEIVAAGGKPTALDIGADSSLPVSRILV